MSPEAIKEIISRLENIRRFTLHGGNDPEDHGDVVVAVNDLCILLRDAFLAIAREGGAT